MQVKFLSLLAFATASLVSAAPQARDNIAGEVYLCPETNWGGACEDIIFELGTCQKAVNLLDGAPVGSLGPNQLTDCLGYTSDDCSGNASWGFVFPGDADAGVASGTPWAGNLGSLVCLSKNPQ